MTKVTNEHVRQICHNNNNNNNNIYRQVKFTRILPSSIYIYIIIIVYLFIIIIITCRIDMVSL